MVTDEALFNDAVIFWRGPVLLISLNTVTITTSHHQESCCGQTVIADKPALKHFPQIDYVDPSYSRLIHSLILSGCFGISLSIFSVFYLKQLYLSGHPLKK